MANVLEQIVAKKREEVAAAKAALSVQALERELALAPEPRDFLRPLSDAPPIRLIAEVKKASPSYGVFRRDFDPVQIAAWYAANGASCLSVVTDTPFFQGELNYLGQIRRSVSLPVLRKDFILDRYQLLQSRCAGADAVLLIAECLDDCQLRSLLQETLQLGMVPLVEFHRPENLERVLDAGATLIGVNNRDLLSFQVDLEQVIRLRPRIPHDLVLVAESGIEGRQDAIRLQDAGVDAMLVGQHLLIQSDIPRGVRTLLGQGDV